MKITPIPNLFNDVLEATVLNSDQYLEKFKYIDHMNSFNDGDMLFILNSNSSKASHIHQKYANRFSVYEISDIERQKLINAGYQMMGLENENEKS